MDTSDYTSILKIYKEDGVSDLPKKARQAFAKALKIERVVGHTTPEALEALENAIAFEDAESAE